MRVGVRVCALIELVPGLDGVGVVSASAATGVLCDEHHLALVYWARAGARLSPSLPVSLTRAGAICLYGMLCIVFGTK